MSTSKDFGVYENGVNGQEVSPSRIKTHKMLIDYSEKFKQTEPHFQQKLKITEKIWMPFFSNVCAGYLERAHINDLITVHC